MNLGEKNGNLTDNLMTGKSHDLSEVSIKVGFICGTYPPEIEIARVNGESFLPILDLDEAIELEYVNPEGSEGTRVSVPLISDVMGARALNHFAEFPVTKLGAVKVTILKYSLTNPEIAGQVNVGQFNEGENWLLIEREEITALRFKEVEMGDDKIWNIGELSIEFIGMNIPTKY